MDMKNECFSRQKEKRVSHSMVKNVLLLALLLVSSVAFAQKKVTGVAVDGTTNEPLPFITIQVKGTTQGTTSDMDGKYEITVPDENSILVYSYIGYRTQEIKVGNQSQIMVRLEEDIEALDEIVVVGYGVQNKRDVTGSIAKVGGDELTSVPTSSFDAALQGRAAGVQVTQSSGLAGSGAAIRVRGIASITAGGDPLIVVDGIPIMQNAGDRVGGAQDNPLSSINSNDIESIDILKDASATAIYGSRGANGVVLITTKRGKEGKPQISFSQKVAFSTPNVTPDMLNTREYLEIYDEALRNDYQFNPSGSTNPATVTTYPGGFTREQALMNNTDWEDEVTRVGVSSYTDFSISWGNKKIKTYAGISHVAENSYMKEDHFGRTSLRLNVDYNPISILKVGANLSYSHVDHRPVPTGWDGGYGRAISNALPYFPVYNEDGSYYIFPMSTNPITEIYEKRRRIFTDRTMASLYADLQIIKDLRSGTFDVLVGINLLREGLDIPECALVAILDADKEGFLRSETSLIQTIGRAARHVNGRVILYADKITNSIDRAVSETARRREKQIAYNQEHGITPKTIQKEIPDLIKDICDQDYVDTYLEEEVQLVSGQIEKTVARLEKEMKQAAEDLNFEEAIRLRDEIKKLQSKELGLQKS